MEIGAQLFTVRSFCRTEDDFAESLKKIAAIGYKTVQVSGTCAYQPEWLKEQLEKNGLRCVLTHTKPALLQSDPARVAKDHGVFGCEYVGLGSGDFQNGETVEHFSQAYLSVAETLRANGTYLMYHNHDHEFAKSGKSTVLARLAEEFAPDRMGFTLDTYWVQAGGADPGDWLRWLKGRVPCIHLKDYAYGAKMAVLGEGNLNFDRILKEAEAAGTRYLLVEQDDCGGEDPFECLKRSYQFLRSRGLE